MLHLGDIKGAGSGARSRRPEAVAAPDWPARFAALAEAAQDPRLRAFYAAGAVAGDTPLAEVPMVAIDVETTGLDPARDEIVSIGLVPMDAACIRSSASRYWVVRPHAELRPESVTTPSPTRRSKPRPTSAPLSASCWRRSPGAWWWCIAARSSAAFSMWR